MDKSPTVHLFPIIFPVFFVAMWCLTLRHLAHKGWRPLESRFLARGEPAGLKIGFVSGRMNELNFTGALNVWIAPEGLFIRPILLFRPFHPALLIPWAHVVMVEERKTMFAKTTEVEIEAEHDFIGLSLGGWRLAELRARAPDLPIAAADEKS